MRGKILLELQGYVGILAGVLIHFFGRQVAHIKLAFAFFADQLCDGDGGVVKVGLGQQVHVVAHVRLEQVVGQHGVEQRPLHLDAVVLHHEDVVLQVLANFADGFALQHLPELLHDLLRLLLVGGQGNIVGLAGQVAERHAHQLGRDGVDAGGLGVEGELGLVPQVADQRLP